MLKIDTSGQNLITDLKQNKMIHYPQSHSQTFRHIIIRGTQTNKINRLYQTQQKMDNQQNKAIEILANLQEENGDYHFEPYKSIVMAQKYKSNSSDRRPKTVNAKLKNDQNRSYSQSNNKREQLKRQLKILEQKNHEEQTQQIQTRKRISTAGSLYYMLEPSLGPFDQRANPHNYFPAQPIKRINPEKAVFLKTSNLKQNNGSSDRRLKIQDIIRQDIKKKFKLRETARQTDRITKINNFLKITTTTPKTTNAATIFFKINSQKMKKTLTSLLS